MDFGKKQKARQALRNIFIKSAAFLSLVIVIVLIVADIKIYKQRKKIDNDIVKYQQQIQELQQRSEKLEEEIVNSDNPDYIEKVAREEQGMQKNGETVVSFVASKSSSQITGVATKTSGYEKWTGWLTNCWNKIIKELF